jgi:hypothetical protein
MQTNCRKKNLTLGGFISIAHVAWNVPLAERCVQPTKPLSSARNAAPAPEHRAGFPIRIAANFYAAFASHVPVGYEDETGFHYGIIEGDRYWLIYDSGGQPLISAGFFTPTSLATVARIAYQSRSDLR